MGDWQPKHVPLTGVKRGDDVEGLLEHQRALLAKHGLADNAELAARCSG